MDVILLSLIVSVVLAVVGVVADFLIKISGAGSGLDWTPFLAGLVIYAATAFGWFFVLKNVKLATIGVFYAVSTILFLTALGVFYFKESLNQYEIIGIGAAVFSLVLLAKFARP